MESNRVDAYLLLVDGKGVLQVEDDDSAGTFNAYIDLSIPSEMHFVLAASSNGDVGTYRIGMAFEQARTCGAEDLAIPGTANGRLDTGNCRLFDLYPYVEDASYVTTYRVTAPRRGMLTIDMTSRNFDTYLFLAAEDGKLVAGDEDTGGGPFGTDARLIAQVNAGTYLVYANSSTTGATGSYSLETSFSDAAACASETIDVNAVVTGQIASSDCRVREMATETNNPNFGRQFVVSVPRRGVLGIDFASIGYAPGVYLMDSQGRRVTDALLRTTGVARITVNVPAGDYTFVLSAGGGGTGDFHLRTTFE
jgi:hypothetical protein